MPLKHFPVIFLLLTIFSGYSQTFSQYTPESPYLNDPDRLIAYVDSCARFWFKSYDATYGGFYTNVDRQGNVITSWGTNKKPLTQTRHAYGFSKAFMLTGDEVFLQKSRDALSFLYAKGWDNTNGGWYNDLNREGTPVELGYLTYLYSKIYVKKEPFSLYYKFEPSLTVRVLSVNPLLTASGKLKITEVTLNGVNFQDFNSSSLELNLAYNTGGKFKVTFTPQDLTSIAKETGAIPEKFVLHQNYPNPFSTGSQSGSPLTTISFELKKAGEVTVKIYDFMGNEIANPVSGYYSAGRHQFKFDGSNLNSGV